MTTVSCIKKKTAAGYSIAQTVSYLHTQLLRQQAETIFSFMTTKIQSLKSLAKTISAFLHNVSEPCDGF